MMELIVQSVQKAVAAMTPWLVGTAIGFFVLWLIMLCYKAKPFAKELKWFFSLTPWHKFIVICTVSFFTLWGGSKERGILPPSLIDGITSTVTRVVETIQPRTLPDGISSNAFVVTDFAVDSQEKSVAFEVAWASNLFENVDSRHVDLFMSTNLSVRDWFPIGCYLMPPGTNSYAFTVSSNEVMAAYRPLYVDSFRRMAFFRFGLDFDSDGDGLTDAYENFVSFTDSLNPDTDGDGLSDSLELAYGFGTNPLLYDTDGDGVGDGDEIAAGTNPRSCDTDRDGLTDAGEFGAMTALTEERFMWFDMSNGTDLLYDRTTADSDSWDVPLSGGTVINGLCYTNVRVCVDGTAYLLCPTNVGDWGSGYSYNLSNTQWSASHVAVSLCGSDLYAKTSDWGSKILYGCVESAGRSFDVVEYRNIGHWNYQYDNELITCQLILPHDETNVVYVSYLCASNAFRNVDMSAGVQCGWMRSWKPGEQFYNLSWPLTAEFPQDGLTIKYSIGTGTDPSRPDTDFDGLLDAEEILSANTNPFVADMDGDGLFDGEEVVLGTDPMNTDTDGDGMPDGWEVPNGLDPLTDDTADDLDGDGLANLREYVLGTSPMSVDSDGDGIPDRTETGWWEYAESMPVFDVSSGTNLLQASRNYYTDTFVVPLPFMVRGAGYMHTNMTVGVCGMIGLMSDRKSNYSFSVPSSNCDLPNYGVNYYHTAVAAYWDYLCSPANSGAQITVADVETNGLRYAVVEYSNIRLYSQMNDASCAATFQIVIPEAETNTVYVHYIGMSAAFDGSSATVGAQLPNREQTHQVSFDTAGAVTNGMVIAYHLGTGSNPAVADTDVDGLDDGFESAFGTSARHTDTDNDGLADGWENANGMNPLSTAGDDGADGDLDGDFLSNVKEFEYGTAPSVADTDGDGLCDGQETGSVFATNAIPWLAFDMSEDLTTEISTNYRRCVSRAIAVPLHIQGETVTNMTISANGIVFLNKAGYANLGDDISGSDFKYEINDNALVLAPYLQYAYIRSDVTGRQTSIKYGTATCDGVGYLLVEYLNSFYNTSTWQTNSISFQLAIPTNTPDRAYSRCCDVTGQYMDGHYASIGMQTFGGRWLHSWCYHSSGRVSEDLALAFLFGTNSNPLAADTDGDGLPDGQEVSIGTSLEKYDTDDDGLPDSWEAQNGLNPLSAEGNDGDAGDPDGDGVDNFSEHGMGSNPNSADSDGDGLLDCAETSCVSFAAPLPWLETSTLTNLTDAITNSYYNCISVGLPSPVTIQGIIVTNITIDADGVVYFNREGYANSEYSRSACDFDYDTVDTNCFTVAPYWSNLFLSDEPAPSSMRFGTAAVGTNGYYVLECLNMYKDLNSWETNSISFQLAFPTGRVDKVHVRYANLVGDEMDGYCASIGFQSFGAKESVSYCSWDQDMVYDGMGLSFILGYGTDPTNADTDGDGLSDGIEIGTYGSDPCLGDSDGDGLSDAQETTLGTGLSNPDSDSDGLLDGWEVANEIDPLSSVGDDGASADLDGDGLTNLQEQTHGGNPRSSDTDGDGLSDALEIANGTDIGKSDSDSDGLTDKQEVDSGFDPLDPDMDKDGMPDGWEVSHGLHPRSAAGDDGAHGDPDHDGLSNIDEYLNNTDPHSSDTDGDGVPDRIEVEREADPTDPSDDGEAPPPELFRTLTFNIYGDWAAWEMQIEGLGPEDTRIRRISMGAPDASETSTMKMRKGNSYRVSMRWLNCGDHDDNMSPWYCWQALIDGLPGQKSFDDDYSEGYCVRISQRNNIIVGNGWIAENEDGLLTSHVHASSRNSHGGSGAGNVAGGLTATLYVLGDPKVIPDYDRDGKIDSSDESIYDGRQTIFRFWANNDNDSGNVNDSTNDRPGSGYNGQDNKVNGRSDLLDFTPVLLDVSGVFPPGTPNSIKERISWKLESSVVNAVWTSLSPSDAGSFHRSADAGATFGPNLSQNAYEATVDRLAGGKELPDGFAQRMKNSGCKGVVMIEGRASGSFLRLQGYIDESTTPGIEGTLDIEISSVEDMFRFVTLRGAHNNSNFTVHIPGRPRNLMDNCKDLDVFFTHGFNVSEADAHAWGSEVFKRLWQSGSNVRFWMFTWSGDYNWLGDAFNGVHYQQDVYQALKTGAALKAFMESAQPTSAKRILMSQSLGNMVACEAMRQGLSVGKYFMFNAAVASEAVDGTLQNANAAVKSKYVPSDWSDYDSQSWAANWHKWFKDDPTDSRGKMGWPDYFSTALARAGTVYNYYSTGDPIFLESDTVPGVTTGIFHWPTLSLSWSFIDFNITAEEGSWQKQETHKGVEPIAGTLLGGWGFNCWYEIVGGEPVQMYYTATQANAMVANGSITNSPVFSYGGTPLNNRNASQDDIWLSLAKFVPAVSSPVGGSATLNRNNVNLNDVSDVGRPNEWGRDHNVYEESWLHSDMKDMAFFYVYKLYEHLVSKGDL